MTEQNMEMDQVNQMLQEMLAQRVSEAVQASLFPHEVEMLVSSGLNEVENPENMTENQASVVKSMYENHVVPSDDLEQLRSLHLMQLGNEIYALRDPDDITRFRESLDRAREIFDAKEAAGENDEERSPLLDLSIEYAGQISEDQIEKVQENAFAVVGVVVLPSLIDRIS